MIEVIGVIKAASKELFFLLKCQVLQIFLFFAPVFPLYRHLLYQNKPKYRQLKNTDLQQMVGIPTPLAALGVIGVTRVTRVPRVTVQNCYEWS